MRDKKWHQSDLEATNGKPVIKAKVMPASKLAETAKSNAELLRDFEASCIDEERHRKTATTAPDDKLKNQPLTRERFEE
jgi:hypothetical protein